ncbi:MAG: hypothetical protein HYS06_05480 [Methylocystis sp.]|nr:hypothetical protein [Methylocystis sp.]
MLHPDDIVRFLGIAALSAVACFAARLVLEFAPAVAIIWRFGPPPL